jgi:hypothetical protein
MMKVKANYKGSYEDLKCRWCKEGQETQKHILTRCPQFTLSTMNTPYKTYFRNDKESYKRAANILFKIYEKLDNPPPQTA